MSANPLLSGDPLPAFRKILPEHAGPAIAQVLALGRASVEQAMDGRHSPGFDTIAQPLEDASMRIDAAWSPVRHLHAVADTPELREAYNACLPQLTQYHTELEQNEELYEAYKALAESDAYVELCPAQRRVVDNALRDFRLGGVALPAAEKTRYSEISTRVSELATKFSENVLDSTQAWSMTIHDETKLSGLPASAKALARNLARQHNEDGWRLNLEMPCYLPVMTYADDRALREEMYVAYSTRASDQGPLAGKWDNTEIMIELLSLRAELAQLLEFNNFAEYSLATKMARSNDDVVGFLRDLAARSRPGAQQELKQLEEFARTQGNDTLEAWDLPYFAEKLRQKLFDFSQEELRPYFSADNVIMGMFEVVRRLFAITIAPRSDVETWHPDVKFFQIFGKDGEPRGEFYLDLFARTGKRGGAWMDSCRTRSITQTPVAYLTCNFTRPVDDKPALLTHDEVSTLFHEFGHGLHHMLTRVDYPSVSGINGVEWDAVELPSQFLENWCWEREALDLIAKHIDTGETIPAPLFEKLQASKNFHAGLKMLRQLEFAMFDFALHSESPPGSASDIQETLETVRNEIAVVKPPPGNRFAHAFSHIFAGGYAAGYYSYKWAEILSADAFSKFEQHGIFDEDTGLEFLHAVLETGGTRDAMTSFIAFRGREPSIDALLRQSGISAQDQAVGGQS